MDPLEFFRWNVVIIGAFVVVVILYLVGLINKRRRDKFLHDESESRNHEKRTTRSDG